MMGKQDAHDTLPCGHSGFRRPPPESGYYDCGECAIERTRRIGEKMGLLRPKSRPGPHLAEAIEVMRDGWAPSWKQQVRCTVAMLADICGLIRETDLGDIMDEQDPAESPAVTFGEVLDLVRDVDEIAVLAIAHERADGLALELIRRRLDRLFGKQSRTKTIAALRAAVGATEGTENTKATERVEGKDST